MFKRISLILVGLMVCSALMVSASGLSDLIDKKGAAEMKGAYIEGDDTSVALRIYNISSSSEIHINILNDLIDIRSINTLGTVIYSATTSAAAVDTIGELVANIEADADLSCSIDDSDLEYTADASLCRYVSAYAGGFGDDNYYDVLLDTAGKTTDVDAFQQTKRIVAKSNQRIVILAVRGIGKTNADDIEISEEDADGTVTKLVDKDMATAGTEYTYDCTINGVGGMTLTKGSDAIIKVNGTAAPDTTDSLQILYYIY